MLTKTLIKRGFATNTVKLGTKLIKGNSNRTTVVVPGIMGFIKDFEPIVNRPELLELSTFFMLDLRNHETSEYIYSWKWEDMATEIYETVQANGISNFDLIGHSMGGKISMLLDTMYQGSVKSLMVVDLAPADYRDRKKYPLVYQAMNHFLALEKVNLKDISFEELSEQIHKLSASEEVARQTFTYLKKIDDRNFEWRANIKAVAELYMDIASPINFPGKSKTPMTLIRGEKSKYIVEEDFKLFNGIYPHFDLKRDCEVIKGAGHWLHLKKPNEFADSIKRFLLKNKKDN